VRIAHDYRGETVLSAFTPLHLEGLSWALIAQIDATEAFAPITRLTRNLIIAAVILVAVVTFLSVALAGAFLRPVATLIAGTQQLSDGNEEVTLLANHAQDEFGELARTFNDLIRAMGTETSRLEALNQEYLSLLFSNLPESVVERFRAGERRIIEQVARATVLFVRVSDYADLLTDNEAEATAALLNELDDAFYEAAERHDLVLFKLIGQQYVAVCGLISQRLDHARRAVDMALSMRNIVNNFNLTNESHLAFHAGLDTGSVMGGIIGHHTFAYDLWGNAVRVAQETKNLAQSGEILVTEDVYQQVAALYTFAATKETVTQFKKPLAIWRMTQSANDRLPSASTVTAEEEAEEWVAPTPTVEADLELREEGADHD
jgi:class 3 adenylate cyclase